MYYAVGHYPSTQLADTVKAAFSVAGITAKIEYNDTFIADTWSVFILTNKLDKRPALNTTKIHTK